MESITQCIFLGPLQNINVHQSIVSQTPRLLCDTPQLIHFSVASNHSYLPNYQDLALKSIAKYLRL
uniref:Uncharacterized protein n=1 Tax=Arundo donax TaxID=35708 RepID=A0A0A9FQQ7_ARUDO